jgi:hypothetical protein
MCDSSGVAGTRGMSLREVHEIAITQRTQTLLHSLAAHIAGDVDSARCPPNFVNFVEEDDAALCI